MVAVLRRGFAILALLLDPVRHISSLKGTVGVLSNNLKMAIVLAGHDLKSRYSGQFLGFIWNILHPLFLMLVFLFIFGVVFKQKIGGTVELPRDYTVYLLSGLVPWLSMSAVLVTGATSVIGNANLVKQFSFPPEIFPIKEIILSMVFWSVGMIIIFSYQLYTYHYLLWTYTLIPIALFIHIGTLLGLCWSLSAVSVFVRDVKDIMTLFVIAGMYVLPIIYLPAWVPDMFKPIIYLNPFSYLIWCYQDALYFGRIEHPEAWVVATVVMLLSLSFGFRVFQRLKPMFGNAL
ncbi:MAG: ABC transporter permease [Hyphomicrobiaceae bacterium]|nr:ABC transporter permease [Hyphomicrobiaceae bacterium]